MRKTGMKDFLKRDQKGGNIRGKESDLEIGNLLLLRSPSHGASSEKETRKMLGSVK